MIRQCTLLTILVIMLGYLQPSYSDTRAKPNVLPAYSKSYSPARNPFEDGKQAIKLAKQTNRQVLIIVGGEWCTWCKAMDNFIASTPAVYRKLHSHYVVLKVNVSEGNDNSKFLAAFPRTHGVPHLFVADQQGSVVRSQANFPLLKNGQYSSQLFLEFLSRWQKYPENTSR